MSLKPPIENPLIEEYFHALLAATVADPRLFAMPVGDGLAFAIRLNDADRTWRLRFVAGRLRFDETPENGEDEVSFLLSRKELAEILAARSMPRDALLAGRIGVRGDVVKALPLSGALEVLLAALASPMSAAQAPTSPVADREETIHFPMGGEMGEVHLAYDNGVDGSRLLVVFPPHPLFGGDADSSVVRAIVRGGVDAGYVTARCNYRGVTAGGFRDDDAHRAWLGWEARRDYAAVRDDAVALLDELHRRFPCAERLVLAGYSFGAVAALMTLAESTVVVRRVMLVSPPLGGHDFDALIAGKGAVPLHILAPTLDPFCSAIDLSSLAARHGVELRLLPVEEHFFRGAEILVRDALKAWMER